ncbi:hypothetical protein FHR32_000059 [Streptosporangium album]|uniref:Uncharacterized protein n=1 Tax=Streptosporangium album TaxID=47479 RepID=A0A7W7RPE6_9ACTN|nr:hypothetical protein [Streptosporangium album]
MAQWCGPRPGKVVAYLTITLMPGGDCLASIAMLRSRSELFGPVAGAHRSNERWPGWLPEATAA